MITDIPGRTVPAATGPCASCTNCLCASSGTRNPATRASAPVSLQLAAPRPSQAAR
ncbi:hypothetical protein [Demequina pelophila]|uniref:hypothetical protein n=1 Tax=Demequina pelophila TaxID=1638984 RepID=UPI000B24865F|nr:hypothetical protein [Demequina pelophila]